MVNPLDRFVSTSAAPSIVKLPEMPKLRDHVAGNQLLDGIESFDQAMEAWRQETERQLNEQFAKTATVSSGPVAA